MSNLSKPVTELAAQFTALNFQLQSEASVDQSLQRLVHLAVASLRDCDWAAVTAWPNDQLPRSLAVSDPALGEQRNEKSR